ncbi:MAG: nucleotidyltransferase family protein [Hyphomicrobiaceae bacterium]
MVLAAGLGTRMRPLTDNKPKPLVPVAGKPLIDHVLDRLAAAGVRRAILNVHHLADQLIAHVATRTRPEIAISDERDHLLDSGGGVLKALPILGPDAFLIHNCDSIWTEGPVSNLAKLGACWNAETMDCLLLLAPAATSLGYHGRGDFALGPDGRLRRPQTAEQVPFAFAGVSVAHPRLFHGAAAGPFSLNRPWDQAIARGRAFGMVLEGRWMHVGDPAAVAAAEAWIADQHER